MKSESSHIAHGNETENVALIRRKENLIKKRPPVSSTAVVGIRADNTTVLLGVILLVGMVTVAQYFAAHFSHSLALLADAIQNTVDLSTYMVNLYVEYVVITTIPLSNSDRPTKHCCSIFFGWPLVVAFYVLSALHRIFVQMS